MNDESAPKGAFGDADRGQNTTRSEVEFALQIASNGYRVFPLRGKMPARGCLWSKRAASSAGDVVALFAEFSDHDGVGVFCGESNVVVVDFDTPPEVAGLDLDTPAWKCDTPRGGQHWFYRADPAHPLSISQGVLAVGVDVRAGHGYVRAYDVPPRAYELTTVPALVWQRAGAKAPMLSVVPDPPAGSGEFGLVPRTFTFAQALAFCRPAMDALASAADGTINARLNDAAVTLSHFNDVPGFWSSVQAQAWLMEALSSTVYDGATWRAESTIASAFGTAAGRWRAVLETEVAGVESGPFPGVVTSGGAVAGEGIDDAVERMRLELLDSEALEALPEPVPLVTGWLDRDVVGAVIGKSGDGKSHVMLDLAGAVGGGTPWHGQEVPAALEVWCLIAEGASGIKRRVRAWEAHHGRRLVGVRFLPRPVQAGSPEWGVLVELARRERPGLIFLDTLARITVGMEENSNSEMGILVDRMELLRRAAGGACVLAVHHLGHSGDQGRGASALKAAWTCELRVRKEKRVGGGWTVVVETSKVKDGAEREPLPLEMRVVPLGTDAAGRAVDSVVLVADALTEAGIGLASGGGSAEGGRWAEMYASLPESRLALIDALDNVFPVNGATKAELLRAVGRRVSRATFDRSWDDLVARGVLVRIDGTQRYKLAHLASGGAGVSNVEA